MTDEEAFLVATRTNPADDTVRLVYADWLDENGRRGGALLRAEHALSALSATDPRRAPFQIAIRDAGAGVDPGWLAMVSRVPIENCGVEFRVRCPKRWEQLSPTADKMVRYCGACQREVVFCQNIEVAQTHTALGDCIAVDSRLVRKPQDLESDFWDLGTIAMGMPLSGEEELGLKDEEPPSERNRRQ